MAGPSLKSLRKRASLALRTGELGVALDAYERLEGLEPRNPAWPQRRAEVFHQLGRFADEIESLERAADVAIDVGEVIQAISLCKQILLLEPDHSETLDRLHLLYSEPMGQSAEPATLGSPDTPTRDPELSHDAPLEELMLTEIVPGAGPAGVDDLGDMGIAEIPLDEEMADSSARAELACTPLFGSLPEESLRALIERVELVSLKEGDVLFHQGDRADTLYVVAEGAVIPIAEEEGRRKLAVLEAGSFFGEIGLMTNQPRNATITALVDTRLLAIDRKAMWQMIKKHPPVLKVMLHFLRDRVVDRLLRSNPFFLAFPARDRPAVAKLFRFLEARDGKVLIEEGQPTKNLYALLSGTVQVIEMGIDGDKVLAELGPGSLFGEMSLLDAEPAVASVVASGKCWVLALSRERLMKLLRGNPEAARIIEELARERLSQNKGRLKAFIPNNDDSLGSL